MAKKDNPRDPILQAFDKNPGYRAVVEACPEVEEHFNWPARVYLLTALFLTAAMNVIAFIKTLREGQDYGSGSHDGAEPQMRGFLASLRARLVASPGGLSPSLRGDDGEPFPVYEANLAEHRAENGYNYLGYEGCGPLEVIERRARVETKGCPLAWAEANVSPALFRMLYLSNLISQPYGGGIMPADSPAGYEGMDSQAFLSQQRLSRGTGRGPSGGDVPAQTGPGVA